MFEDSGSPNKNQNKSKGYGLEIFLGLVVIILLIITIYISGIKHTYKMDLKKIRQDYDLLQDKDVAIKKVKSQRVEFFRKQAFLNHPDLSAFSAANFIRKLSLITPGNLYLLELNLEPLDQNINFILKGMVYGASEVKNRGILAGFYRQLGLMDEVIQIFSSPPKPGDKTLGYIEFSVKGELEVE